MPKINEVLKKYAIKPYRYEKKGKVTFLDTEDGRYVAKEKRYDTSPIFRYLDSRSFSYYPKSISNPDEPYEITPYLEEFDLPREQKILDMVDLVSLLHNKTTHYKEVDEDDYKKIYEDIANNIAYLESYYMDIITIIESHVYMSPSEFLLARNISVIFNALHFSKSELEKWYQLVKDKRKMRQVVLHNNLSLDHFIRNENSYLISWDKSKIDLPIFDIYKLYKNHNLEFDFSDILKRYERNYPLLEDEKKLLFILIALPEKIEFHDNEYHLCKQISEELDVLLKTEKLISPYYTKQ